MEYNQSKNKLINSSGYLLLSDNREVLMRTDQKINLKKG